MNTNIHLNKKAKKKLVGAINHVADSVRITLGAKGRNAGLQETLYPYYIVTNDGISIVNKAHFDDPVEQMGANILKEVAQRTNHQSGDGTTTSIVLTQALINEGLKYKSRGIEIKNALDALLPFIEMSIDAQKIPVTEDMIEQVAIVSAESESLGKLIAEIYRKIGKEGIIELDNSKTFETFYEIRDGVRFQSAGFMSNYMANDNGSAVYKKPHILVVESKIGTLQELVPLVEKLNSADIHELIIFCEDIDPAVLSTLVMNTLQGTFKTVVVKAPNIMKDAFFEDLAKATGAKLINEQSGATLKTTETADLGTCSKITITRDQTTILGVADISEHVARLGTYDDPVSKFRYNRLNAKAAILKLGANSEVELSYIRLKAEDAVNATKLALQDGVVVGGGVCLLNVANSLPGWRFARLMRYALKSPLRQIIKNAGKKPWLYMNWFWNIFGDEKGFDAKTNQLTNMVERGILDPAAVVKNAVRNAISVASTVLTTEAVVTLPIIQKEESPFQQ